MSAWKSFILPLLALTVGSGLVSCTTGPQLPPSSALPEPTAESMGTKPVTHPGLRDRLKPKASPSRGQARPTAVDHDAFAKARRDGLATSFGEAVDSEIDYQEFKRGFLAKPFAVGALYYNDAQGASAMANSLGTPIPLRGGLLTAAKGVLDWGLKSPRAKSHLGGYLVDGKVILRGAEKDRYVIELRNNTRQPLEFVVSVDGLDVMDGEPASYSKRGYIVGPKRTLEIEGFRTSESQVAAFRFGKVSDSYAALRHDNTRNVGVIGVAVFTKNGKNPWVLSDEIPKRDGANPFPGQRFAVPPH